MNVWSTRAQGHSLVVDDSRNEGQDEPARPARLGVTVAVLHMLPQQPSILFVHAHRLLQLVRLTPTVVQGSVEVLNLPQAVAPELQRIRAEP